MIAIGAFGLVVAAAAFTLRAQPLAPPRSAPAKPPPELGRIGWRPLYQKPISPSWVAQNQLCDVAIRATAAPKSWAVPTRLN